jgi:hypothetical protein
LVTRRGGGTTIAAESASGITPGCWVDPLDFALTLLDR